MQNAKYKTQSAKCKVRNAKFEVQNEKQVFSIDTYKK